MFDKLFMATDKITGKKHVSWMKVGGTIFSVTSAVVLSGICPPAALPVAKAIIAIGSGIGFIGARDALGK